METNESDKFSSVEVRVTRPFFWSSFWSPLLQPHCIDKEVLLLSYSQRDREQFSLVRGAPLDIWNFGRHPCSAWHCTTCSTDIGRYSNFITVQKWQTWTKLQCTLLKQCFNLQVPHESSTMSIAVCFVHSTMLRPAKRGLFVVWCFVFFKIFCLEAVM